MGQTKHIFRLHLAGGGWIATCNAEGGQVSVLTPPRGHSFTRPSCQSGRAPPPLAAVCMGCALYRQPQLLRVVFPCGNVSLWDRQSPWRKCSVRRIPRKESGREVPGLSMRSGMEVGPEAGSRQGILSVLSRQRGSWKESRGEKVGEGRFRGP